MEKSLSGDPESQKKYDWIMLELFDQIVRNYSGGEMLKYWQQNRIPSEEFVIERVGSEAKEAINNFRTNSLLTKIDSDLEQSPLQIGQFRLSGEIHQWMYDRYSIKKLLKETGFTDIKVCTAYESRIPCFNEYYLDVEPDNSVRKPDSLFMEAIK